MHKYPFVIGLTTCWLIACGGVDNPEDPEFHDCTEDLNYTDFDGWELEMSHFDPRICPVDGREGELHDNGTITTSVMIIDGAPHDTGEVNYLDLAIYDMGDDPFGLDGAKQWNWTQFNTDGSGERSANMSTQYDVDFGESRDWFDFGVWPDSPDRENQIIMSAYAEGFITYCWDSMTCPEGEGGASE